MGKLYYISSVTNIILIKIKGGTWTKAQTSGPPFKDFQMDHVITLLSIVGFVYVLVIFCLFLGCLKTFLDRELQP